MISFIKGLLQVDGRVPWMVVLVSAIIGALLSMAYVKFARPKFLMEPLKLPGLTPGRPTQRERLIVTPPEDVYTPECPPSPAHIAAPRGPSASPRGLHGLEQYMRKVPPKDMAQYYQYQPDNADDASDYEEDPDEEEDPDDEEESNPVQMGAPA